MNKRNLKALEKQGEKDRKYTKDSRSEGDASKDSDVEMDDKQNEKIPTKTKGLSLNVHNKRFKKSASLESEVKSEIQEA